MLATAPIKSFDRGQLVLDQNVLLRAIFLIEEGAVRVERRDRDQTIPLALLEAGEFFGEMSYVDGAPDERHGHCRRSDPLAGDRRGDGQRPDQEGSRLCRAGSIARLRPSLRSGSG